MPSHWFLDLTFRADEVSLIDLSRNDSGMPHTPIEVLETAGLVVIDEGWDEDTEPPVLMPRYTVEVPDGLSAQDLLIAAGGIRIPGLHLDGAAVLPAPRPDRWVPTHTTYGFWVLSWECDGMTVYLTTGRGSKRLFVDLKAAERTALDLNEPDPRYVAPDRAGEAA